MHLSLRCRSHQKKTLIRFLFLSFSLTLFCSVSLHAQRVVTTEAGATHRVFSPEDGIPSHSPTNALISNDGYVWISTTGGTIRMSGNEIEDFGAEYGLPMMQNIYYDRNRDVMWFSDSRTLASFDGDAITIYGEEEGFDPPGGGRKEARPVLADSQGRLWIGSYTPPFDSPQNGGLMVFKNGEFKTISFEELPLHNITGAFEASDGTIWFSSAGYSSDGIFSSYSHFARYTEGEFEIFDEESGCANVMTVFREPEGFGISITEDKNGNIWFVCNGMYDMAARERKYNGLFRFDGANFESIDHINERLSSNPFNMFLFYDERSNEVYFTFTPEGGYTEDSISEALHIYNNGEWRTEEVAAWDELQERSSVILEDDAIYFGFYLVRTKGGQIIANLQATETGSNDMKSIVFRKQDAGWEWIDSIRGFFLTNLFGEVYLTALGEPDVLGIYTPPSSRLLTSEHGLLQYPLESNTGGSYYRPRFFTDSDGNVWINYANNYDPERGSYTAYGTTYWDGERFISLSTDDGFSSNNLLFVNQSLDGALWFPSDNGVNRLVWDDDSPMVTTYTDSDGTPFFSRKIVERANGEIFTFNNYVTPANDAIPEQPFFLGRLQGDSFERFDNPFPDSLASLPYQEYELIADRDNRMWLTARFAEATGDALFLAKTHHRIMIDDEWIAPPEDWDVPATRLFYVGELNNGLYYMKEGGFLMFDFDQERFVDLTDSTNTTADFRIMQRVNTAGMVFNIESDDYLYIRFRDMGLAVFDGTNLTYLDRRNGLPSLRISYPQRDRNGDMLFTTPTGGIIFDGPDFTAIRDDAVSGLTARGIARDKNNNILIQHLGQGITITQMDTTKYPVRISSILADGDRFYEGQSPRLKPDQNNIEFRFSTLNFTNSDDIQFSYLLDGYDADWSRPSRANFREFRNLPSGDYTFHVRSVGPGTVMSEPVQFAFSIAPPWWRTWWAYGLYLLLFLAAVFAINRLQRRRLVLKEREKARERELEQAREIEKAYKNLEVAHENLKAAQEQLVQQEKLASLGQLTAGIAHEIKNPLNFVNNFSEVSLELIGEARDEVKNSPLLRGAGGVSDKDNDGDQPYNSDIDSGAANTPLNPLSRGDLLLEILDDIEANLKKIHEHGSRADNIVRSMLLHSRGGGEMQPTGLNGLVKEYVNLAFHGMRASKNPINVDIDLQLDENVGEVPLVAEDFSRVILNVCNNAFDAVSGKLKVESGKLGAYSPKLSVRTKSTDGNILIEIEDNGPGIPDDIKDKILQPFFTTKKGKQGTGLGLSITNDIIKAHGGELKVETKEGAGSTFIIQLPLASGEL